MGARTPTVMAVFAANGGCDASGPYLIPDDANAEPGERIRVKTILDAAAKLPPDTRKLIVFDTANTSAPAVGQFSNDFARGVQSLESDISAVPKILCQINCSHSTASKLTLDSVPIFQRLGQLLLHLLSLASECCGDGKATQTQAAQPDGESLTSCSRVP